MALETIENVSRLSGVPVTTLRRWARQRRLTAVQHGRAWMLDPLEAQELASLRGRAGRLPRSDKGAKRDLTRQ